MRVQVICVLVAAVIVLCAPSNFWEQFAVLCLICFSDAMYELKKVLEAKR